MQNTTNDRYTMLVMEGRAFTHYPEMGFNVEDEARASAKFLNAQERADAKTEARSALTFVAVRTLESISRNTEPSELTIGDVRWLAGEAVDRCDFFTAAPEWARKVIDSVADRRNFDEKYVKRVLSAIRCVLSVERQMGRQVDRHEAAQANSRRY